MAQPAADVGLDQATDAQLRSQRETPLTAPPRDAPSEPLPRPFGRYELRRLLGRGAMGAVYLAHDAQLDRLVALKIPRPLDEDPTAWRERFLSEARSAATLHHPNICSVFEVGEVDAQPYLTMAYIEGETLGARLRRDGPLAVSKAVDLVRTISCAMAEAHDRGIVHRDLKPANLMLDRRGQPVIMDFGLALRATNGDLRLTLSGVALGTPSYMPPEQAGGDLAAIGPAADVYALGVILFELVTGRVPFQAPTFGKLLAQIERDPVPPPRSLNPAIDERLEGVILRALAKTPEERFVSAAELADALDACRQPREGALLAETADWKPSQPAVAPSSKRRRTVRRAVALGLLGLAAVALGIVIYVSTDYGTLVVQVSDSAAAATVKINDKEVILDPDDRSIRIRARKDQKLDVSSPGFKSVSQQFDLVRGERKEVTVTLVPEAPPAPAARHPAAPPRPVAAAPAVPPFTFASADALIEIPGWQIVAGATQEEMKAWLAGRKQSGHSVLWLDGATVGDQPVFAAIAALDDRRNDWEAFVDLTEQEVNDVAVLVERGLDRSNYVVTCVGGYFQEKELTGFGLYHRGAADGMAGVRNKFSAMFLLMQYESQGFVARVLRPVVSPGGQVYFGMYVEAEVDTKSRHQFWLRDSALKEELEKQRREGAYPLSVVPYDTGGQRWFALTFREDPELAPWELVHDVQAKDLKAKAEELAFHGMVPVSIAAYPLKGEAAYSIVWRAEQMPAADQPADAPTEKPAPAPDK